MGNDMNSFKKALKKDDFKKISKIITEKNVNNKDENGYTALFHCCEIPKLEIVSLLLNKKADVGVLIDKKSLVEHFCLLENINLELLKILLPAASDKSVLNQITPQIKNHIPLRLLLENQADPNVYKNKERKSTLLHFDENQSIDFDLIKIMVESKLDLNQKGILNLNIFFFYSS